MAQQKITVKIAGRPYVLNASSEEHERKIRVSADEINKKVNAYLDKFPGKKGNGYHPFHRSYRSIQSQFPHNKSSCQPGAVGTVDCGNKSQSHGKVERRSFFTDICRGKIDESIAPGVVIIAGI